MSDSHLPEHNRRRFSRINMVVAAELHQGGVVWDVQLIDISLNGIAVTQPADWDAEYSHPFNVVMHLDDGETLELFAHLIHVEAGSLGFQMEHLGDEQVAPLAKLLASKLDAEVITQEIKRLPTA